MNDKDYVNLEEAIKRSTQVVAWYPHHEGDQCKMGEATVRGPWNRWFVVSGGNGESARKAGVASTQDDARFAAAAMNNVAKLLEENKKFKREIELLKAKVAEYQKKDNEFIK